MRPFFLTALLVATTSLPVLAQPGSGGPTPGNATTAVPVDGGASLLLAGGMGYALRRLRTAREQAK